MVDSIRGLLAFVSFSAAVVGAEYQWSVPMGEGRAFLWIPPDCAQVRGVVVAQNNMLEPGILEHPQFRAALARQGMAEVLVAPPFDPVFRFDRDAGERFEAMIGALADESGYGELREVPAVPMGHSACASFPWNFAAWNPRRTLAILSLKGDAPLTPLTGSGKPNPDWGGRTIEGIPGLMAMGEYEWWEERLMPAFAFRTEHPGALLTLVADVGHGHFDAFDSLVELLAMFVEKSAAVRLPRATSAALQPVEAKSGWLVDRWRGNETPGAPAAPFSEYRGDPREASWCFDEAMARRIERSYARTRSKRRQQVDFVQQGELAEISTSHAGVTLRFVPESDGVTFHLDADFIVPLPPRPPVAAKDAPPPVRRVKPDHATEKIHAAGEVRISPIAGPVEQTGTRAFRVALSRTTRNGNPWSSDVWLLAWHPGDETYTSAVQQAVMKLPRNDVGEEQVIRFPAIDDQRPGGRALRLQAISSAGLPVRFYVREGPAEIVDGELRLTAIPPRAAFPMKVTVVAWQMGRGVEPRVRAAAPVEQTFRVVR